VPIACGDVAVFPNDVIVGDSDGVMVIPAHIAEDVANECLDMTLYETFVIEKVNAGQSIIGLYPATDPGIIAEFENWKKNKKI